MVTEKCGTEQAGETIRASVRQRSAGSLLLTELVQSSALKHFVTYEQHHFKSHSPNRLPLDGPLATAVTIATGKINVNPLNRSGRTVTQRAI